MRRFHLHSALALLVLGLVSTTAPAASEPIYGSQLMTRQERIEHRQTLRTLKTQQERDAYRLEHHQKMQERAKARGTQLPDAPPQQGMGMGPGPGMGGMGGGGMGPRGGR